LFICLCLFICLPFLFASVQRRSDVAPTYRAEEARLGLGGRPYVTRTYVYVSIQTTERSNMPARSHGHVDSGIAEAKVVGQKSLFLGSIFIDQATLNGRRPSSSIDAEPAVTSQGRVSSWFDRGPRPASICTAAMQASTQAIEPSRSAECLDKCPGTAG